MFHVSARVGIFSCSYTPQIATWFFKVPFTKAKVEGHKWCKLKFEKDLHRWSAQIDEAGDKEDFFCSGHSVYSLKGKKCIFRNTTLFLIGCWIWIDFCNLGLNIVHVTL